MKTRLPLALCAALTACATPHRPLEPTVPARPNARERVLEDSLAANKARAALLEWRVAELER